MHSSFLPLLFTVLIGFQSLVNCEGQDLSLTGTVHNDDGKVLSFANVVAYPMSDFPLEFSITDREGAYNLTLHSSESYLIVSSFLGCRSDTLLWEPSSKMLTEYNFVLTPQSQVLDDVTISAKVPIKLTEDTITFSVDFFTDGSEKKLKDILKKLPGIHMQENGSIYIEGERITQLLVDGEQFFTGGTKLGTENIPSKVIEDIEIIRNYQENQVLGSLKKSDEKAINVKLKRDGQATFSFGSAQIQGGHPNYSNHANLFLYSSTANVNYIGDLNNTGEEVLSLREIIDLNGGFDLLSKDPDNFFKKFDIHSFGDNFEKDFSNKKSDFNMFDIVTGSSDKTSIKLTGTSWGTSPGYKNQNLNSYLLGSETLTEYSSIYRTIGSRLLKINLKLKHQINATESISAEIASQSNNKISNIETSTERPNGTGAFSNQSEQSIRTIQNKLNWHKKHSEMNGSEIELYYQLKSNLNGDKNTGQNEEYFHPFLNFDNIRPIGYFQNIEITNNDFTASYIHYLKVAENIILSPRVGMSQQKRNLTSLTERSSSASDGFDDLSSQGFNNDFKMNINLIYFLLNAKFTHKKMELDMSLSKRFYKTSFSSLQIHANTQNENIFPNLKLNYKLNKASQIVFNYLSELVYSDTKIYAPRFILKNHNVVQEGLTDFQGQQIHTTQILYAKAGFLSKTDFSAVFNHTFRTSQVTSSVNNLGFSQNHKFVLRPYHSTDITVRVKRRSRSTTLNFVNRWSLQKYQQEQEGRTNQITAFDYSIGANLSINSSALVFVKLGVIANGLKSIDDNISFNYLNYSWNSKLDFDFPNLTIGLHYEGNIYKSEKSTSTSQHELNCRIEYSRRNSPFEFSISGANLLNSREKLQQSYSDFIISERSSTLLPRIVMFSIGYDF